MDILEGNMNFTGATEREVPKLESKEQKDVTYKGIEVQSFSQAVKEIMSSENKEGFCFVDYDWTLTDRGLRNIRDPKISAEVKASFNHLLSGFSPGRLCITTDRGFGSSILGNLAFKTDKALEEMVTFLEGSNYPGTVPIFLGLKKQVPNLNAKEDLINHLVVNIDKNNFNDRIKIIVIEDSFVLGLDRSVFPKEIARKVQQRVKEELDRDIGIDIIDYVLKK
jgi:hypothetical protein